MFSEFTNYSNVKWPVRVMDGLRSQNRRAKLAATMLHDNMDTIRNDIANNRQYYDMYNMVYLRANQENNRASFVQSDMILSLFLGNTRRKFNYISGDNFFQNSHSGRYGDYNCNKLSSNRGSHQVLEQESKNDYKSLTQIIPDSDKLRQGIPYPALFNNNGNVQTIYKYDNNNTFSFRNLEEQELHDGVIGQNVNPSDISDQLMADFVEQIDKNSPLKQRDFKEQYNYIKYFERCEVCDGPVSLATEAYSAYLKLQEDTFIIDSEVGERMEVQKQGDVFNIDFYNKDNKLSMQGEFTILKDAQGVPLKEDEDGKILDQNNANYNNRQNKLCFNMKLTTYHEDTGKRSCDFERTVDLDDRKHRQNMSLSNYDRNEEMVRNEEISMPYYSSNKLKARFPKVFYNTYKSDLKDLNEELTSKRLHPDDIQFNLE